MKEFGTCWRGIEEDGGIIEVGWGLKRGDWGLTAIVWGIIGLVWGYIYFHPHKTLLL
ncbi:hypothetical protein J2S74_004851 [Evansella vedderi]|uniref:Uncharacterized protein n=1 Tax=Evansella vedderi TaxID=38282 RepID=A0ABU0A3X6_9BACI|nr:hypothetical protein [Evansella vedderi]MDQ0257393.1 hypothetical protein [Evansella vedderi]